VSWPDVVYQLVLLCTFLDCDAAGAAGRWVSAEWALVWMTPVWAVLVAWFEFDSDVA
jgi:hypothetical protein